MVVCKIFISVAMEQGHHIPSSAAQAKIRVPLLEPGNYSKVKSLANPKMAPLNKILTSLLPFPTFLLPHISIHQALSNPPFLPSLYQSPLTSTPRSPCTNLWLAILSTSNIQEDNSMIFFIFTFLFTFSKITNYSSVSFIYG